MKKNVSILLVTLISLISCNKNPIPDDLNFKQEMRNFVQEISSYAKAKNNIFFIIPQNGAEIVSKTGDDTGSADNTYINAIDGIGQESLFYGYDNDDKDSPESMVEWTSFFLDMAKNNGDIKIIVTDYCSTHSKMDDSFNKNNNKAYISFAANERELNNIPAYPERIYNENDNIITSLQEAKNFLYLINPDENFSTAQEFVDAVANTNYDFIIMDFFFQEGQYTKPQIEKLKQKANGGKRLLICYMSIGEAEDYRYYWKAEWNDDAPIWLEGENPRWKGNYIVRYWEQEWKDIIFGNDNSYLNKIIDAGFDGVYLDIIDGFENFE